jgi:trehalose 6-phosphate phosphatase
MADEGRPKLHADLHPRVVIVDDDAEMRALLRDVLERDGFLVHEHSTGDGLVPLLEEWIPDAIVLDKEMAGSNGLDLLPDIRRLHPHMPVVFVTAFGGSDVEAEALRLGAAYYMDKPFRVARLLDVLRAVVGSAKRERDPLASQVHPPRSVCRKDEPADPAELALQIAWEARSHAGLLLFTTFDGMLGPGVRDGRGVGLPLLVRGALVALATTPDTRVVIISGEDACDLKARINVPGVIYAGCRGLQIRGPGIDFCHPAAVRLRETLPLLARELSDRLASVPGAEVEIKQLSITVHTRRVDHSAVSVITAEVEELRRTSAAEFTVCQSESAVDLFPDVDWGRGSTALWILKHWVREERGQPTVVYVGDDDADEEAYMVLREHGYAIHVGRQAATTPCWVIDRPAAIDLLAQIAFAWRVHSVDR